MHFFPVFELMSDSLMAIYVEPNQCPSHQSILLTQGPIHEIFIKKYRELAILKNDLFLSQTFLIFLFQRFFFCFITIKISHKLCITIDGTQIFYDYDGLQPKVTPPKHISRQFTNHRTPKLDMFWAAKNYYRAEILEFALLKLFLLVLPRLSKRLTTSNPFSILSLADDPFVISTLWMKMAFACK